HHRRDPRLAVQLGELGARVLLRLALALGIEGLGQGLGELAAGEEGVRRLLVLLVARAALDPLLRGIIVPAVGAAATAPRVDLPPAPAASAARAVAVVAHHEVLSGVWLKPPYAMQRADSAR